MIQTGQEDRAGRHRCALFMQVTWNYLMCPMLSHKRLPWPLKCPNLLRFWRGMAKGTTKWMVELPDVALGRLVWLGAYARTALEESIYCPVCIQFASRIWIPRLLRVGKVVVKVSLKWPLGAGFML